MPVTQNDKCPVKKLLALCTLVNGYTFIATYISQNGRKCLATVPSYDV